MIHLYVMRKNMSEPQIPVKAHTFIRWSFLAGLAWCVVGLIYCTDQYKVDEEELIPAFVPGLILMAPTFAYFFFMNQSPELIPGFVGLYFKRKRMEEEKRIEEIIGKRSESKESQNQKTTPKETMKRIALQRLGKAMADEKSTDPILKKIEILTESEFQWEPMSTADIDKKYGCRPVAVMKNGNRIYPYLKNDGRGQINVMSVSGLETTIKFHFPENLEALLAEPVDGHQQI